MIPVYEPCLEGNEVEYVRKAVESGWVSSIGEFIIKFENRFAKYCGTKFSASCSNGTTALHLALKAFGVKEGDEVIVPNVTFIATANAVSYCNAKPVFVDIEENSWCIDPKKIEEKITKKTKGIIAVHLYGMPAPMDEIKEIAEKNGLFVLEDGAEAIGAEYKGKRVGSLGDAAVFSFYGNKVITSGEGGMILSDNKELIEKIKILRDHGMNRNKKFWHEVIGFNYRMTNMQAALGLAQLENIDNILEKKMAVVKEYDNCFRENEKIGLQPNIEDRRKICWLYTILIENLGTERDKLIVKLRENGIDSRPFFYPLTDMPPYKSGEHFPVSRKISYKGISLPSSPKLKKEEIQKIANELIGFI